MVDLLANGAYDDRGDLHWQLQPTGSSASIQANHLAILNADGTMSPSFTADKAAAASGKITTLAFGAAATLAGGSFGPIDGSPGSNLVRFNADGAPDLSYNPLFDGPVNAIGVHGERIRVSAPSTYALWLERPAPSATPMPARATDSSPSSSSNPTARSWSAVYSPIFRLDRIREPRAAQCRRDGRRDVQSDPNGAVDAIAIQSDGKIIIGGAFTQIGATPFLYLARLNTDGTLDASFKPAPDLGVTAIAIQPNGQVIAGGYFTSVETTVSTTLTVRNQIARFNADGTLDANSPRC